MIEKLIETCKNGVLPAMATPTNDDFSPNLEVVKGLVDFLLDKGVAGLFVGGTTGEGIAFSAANRQALHETAVTAAAGRAPVLIHAGANRLDDTLTLAIHGERIGADGVVVITPYFFGMPDAALADYFRQVASTVPETPFMVYDIPQMAVNGVSPSLYAELIDTIPNFAGIKSSHHDAQHIRRLLDVEAGRGMLLAGNESIALGSLAMGATGLISGLSTAIPEPFVAMCNAFAANDLATAQMYQRQINRLLALLPAGARLGGVKTILAKRGISAGKTIPPRPMPATDSWWDAMEALLD